MKIRVRNLVLLLIAAFLCLNAALAALFILRARVHQQAAAADIPVLYPAPDFTLTSAASTPFDSGALKGKVWLAYFFFTACSGPCPAMARAVQGIAGDFSGNPALNFVSITVDPETDTPERLTKYAAQYEADPARWHFLTGDLKEIQRIGESGFKLGSADEPIFHSTELVLVDRRGQIRGYYTGTDADEVGELKRAIAVLLRESAT